ncbi:MAG TPA: hypothetical protein VF828_03915 [Patescibacteria group bacterium]
MTDILDLPIRSHANRCLTLLNSGREISLEELIPSYVSFSPLLHPLLNSDSLDVNALNYCLTRLPDQIFSVSKVILVQSYDDLKSLGFSIASWVSVPTLNRRRLSYINPTGTTLVCLLSSESDIHDIVNELICFYVELQKMQNLLKGQAQDMVNSEDFRRFNITETDWLKLKNLLGRNWAKKIISVTYPHSISLRLYGRTEPLFVENAKHWLNNLTSQTMVLGFNNQPVYFVSSNSHSLVNVIGGFVSNRQNYIFDYVTRELPLLYQQWFSYKKDKNISEVNDFLYYISSHFLKTNPQFNVEKTIYETSLGIKTIPSDSILRSDVQIIPVRSLSKSLYLDNNLVLENKELFSKSDAYIVNIEYPLGFAAYYLMKQVLANFTALKSIYIMGKAAILKGSIGDITIPTAVYDEITNNTYSLNNTFNHNISYSPNISSIKYDQKSVCVFGTYLENEVMANRYLQNGFNSIEMENGAYLKAIAEKYLLSGDELSVDTQYDVSKCPFDLGIINYASDNPLVKTLAQESLGLEGIEPAYLGSLSILQRIINLETARLKVASSL